MPFVLVQISDPHLGAAWAQRDPVPRLAAVVAAAAALRPDAVLVSGDLADHAADEEYAAVRERLGAFAAPVHVLAGNHDRRAPLRRHFGLAGRPDDPVQFAADAGPVRLLGLDTTRPGEDAGELDGDRLGWLDAALSADDRPTIVALHHPPLHSGTPSFDALVLPAADREALAAVVARHRHVRRIVAGHVHRTIVGDLAGVPTVAVPSAYVQLAVDPRAEELRHTDEPPAFAVHIVDGDAIATHVVAVGDAQGR